MNRRDLFTSATAASGVLALSDALDASPAKRTPVIDAHCHVGRGELLQAPWHATNSADVTLRRMDEVGIDQTIIFPNHHPTYERANEEIARVVQKHPGRFIGFAKHDPDTEAGKIRELLAHEVRKLGLKGLKLHKVPTKEIMEAVAELGIPILIHPPRMDSVVPMLRAYPRVNFILAHLGSFGSANPKEHLRAFELVNEFRNAYLETSSAVQMQYLEMAAKKVPEDKLMFGSDGPLLDPRVELYKIRLLQLPKVHEEKVLGGNVARILPR